MTVSRIRDSADQDTALDMAPGPDAADHRRGWELIASTEPAIVFASLAERSVAQVCDSCTVEIVEDGGDGYRIAYPPISPAAHEHSTTALAPNDRIMGVQFTGLPVAGDGEVEHGYHGVATFTWHARLPTRADRLATRLLVEHAVCSVAWQRSEQHARVAEAAARHLQTALQTSRHIGMALGILMSSHKITEAEAFDLLRTASQQSHCKLREIALEVIDTGCLDQAHQRHRYLAGPARGASPDAGR